MMLVIINTTSRAVCLAETSILPQNGNQINQTWFLIFFFYD